MASPNSGIGDDESHLIPTHRNSPISVPGCGPTGGNNQVMMSGSTSPLLLPSNNITIPGSSVADDGSNAVQGQDPTIVQVDVSNATSRTHPLSRARRAPESLVQVLSNLTQAQKKPRLSNQVDDQTRQVLGQWLQRQEMLQQQRAQLQQQLRQKWLQQQQLQQFRGPRLYEDSVCARRLVEYLYQQRHRPSNSIGYWRNVMTEFFSPCAKKRWCFSYIPRTTTSNWQCNLCDSKSGRGIKATFESFPRLHTIKYAIGVLDEVFTLNTPSERRYGSGITVLEYDKVVQETVFEHVRVVREGHLRILFSPQLKILSWEFCTRRLQKLLPQVNQVAKKCQSTINQSGSDGISQQDLQANSKLVMAARSQLAKSVERIINGSRGLPPDRNNSLNKHMALRNSGTNIAMNNMNGQGSLLASAQAAASAQATASVLANYQTMLMKQNHPKSEPNNTTIKQEPSTRNQNASQGYQGSGPLLPDFMQIKQEPSTRSQNASQGYQGSGPLLPGFVQIKQEPSTRNQNASQGYQGSGPLLPDFVQIKQEPSTRSQNASQGYQGSGPLLPDFVQIKQEPSTRSQNASQGYQGSGPLLPGFVQIKQEPSISGVSSHLSPQQQTSSSIYNGSTPQYHQQPLSGSSSNQTLEQKPLCVPAAETPSTSDKGTNGLGQSQNLGDMGSDTSLDFDEIWEHFCVKILSSIN